MMHLFGIYICYVSYLLRAKPTKFICINDNQKKNSIAQFAVIRDFFEAMWYC
jgi:hypothetical protein